MPTRQAHLRRVRHWMANRGLRGVLKEVAYRVRLKLQGKPLPGSQHRDTGPHPFDVEHGVDTAGLVWGESLLPTASDEHSKEAQYWATGYYGIAPSVVTSALDRLALDWPRFTFIDIGCGKGRALLVALGYPFRGVLGVEFSPNLVEVAQANLARFAAPWRQAIPAEAIAADATSFSVPLGPLVIYLYHPFAAPVMRRFLAHIAEAAKAESREIFLLYTNPELRSMLDGTPGFTRLWEDWPRLTEAETAADRFGSTQEHTAAYRIEAA